MKMTERQIHNRAVALTVMIEGLLIANRNTAGEVKWLVFDRGLPKILHHVPTTEKLICRVSDQDCQYGFPPGRWNHIKRECMEFLRKENK